MPFKHTVEYKVTFEYLGKKQKFADLFRPRTLVKDINAVEQQYKVERIKPDISDAKRAMNKENARLKSIIKAILKQAGFEIVKNNELNAILSTEKKAAITQGRFRSGGSLIGILFGAARRQYGFIYNNRFEMVIGGDEVQATEICITKSHGEFHGTVMNLADPNSFERLASAIQGHHKWMNNI